MDRRPEGRPPSDGNSADRPVPRRGLIRHQVPFPRPPLPPTQYALRSVQTPSRRIRALNASHLSREHNHPAQVAAGFAHPLNIVSCMAPVALGTQIAKKECLLSTKLNSRDRTADFPGNGSLALGDFLNSPVQL